MLRYTPADVAVVEFEINHSSQQMEAGINRQVSFAVNATALGELATMIANLKIDNHVKLTGFMARKNRNNSQLVLHVNHVAQL